MNRGRWALSSRSRQPRSANQVDITLSESIPMGKATNSSITGWNILQVGALPHGMENISAVISGARDSTPNWGSHLFLCVVCGTTRTPFLARYWMISVLYCTNWDCNPLFSTLHSNSGYFSVHEMI